MKHSLACTSRLYIFEELAERKIISSLGYSFAAAARGFPVNA